MTFDNYSEERASNQPYIDSPQGMEQHARPQEQHIFWESFLEFRIVAGGQA